MKIFKGCAHIGSVFILAFVVYTLSALLISLEDYMKNIGMPNWFLTGTHWVGVMLFIIDSILLIGSSLIAVIKILKVQIWSNEE
jgi:hypothetical protein